MRTRTFYHAGTGRADWKDVNAARFRAGERIGITYHVASVLGSYGFSSPTYFPSPDDVTRGNDAMLELCDARAGARAHVRHGESELHRARARARSSAASLAGAIGIKLLASRRADDPLLDPIAEVAAERGLPVLHHIWQHRRARMAVTRDL